MASRFEPAGLKGNADRARVLAIAGCGVVEIPIAALEDDTLKALAEAYGELEVIAHDVQTTIVEIIAERRYQQAKADEEAARRAIEEATGNGG